jgi:hypothetical protein
MLLFMIRTPHGMTFLKTFACFVSALFLCALAPPATAQRDTNGVQIPLSVIDQDGRFVPGVRADQLRVRDKRISIVELKTSEAPRHIVFLMDMGSDMALRWSGMYYDRWRLSRGGAEDLLSKLSPQDTVSIYAFAEKAKALVVNTNDFRGASSLVNQLPVPGNKESRHEFGERSKFANAFREVLKSEDDKLHFGDVIVLFSCGEIGGEDTLLPSSDVEVAVEDEKGALGKLQPQLVRAGIRAYWFPATPLGVRFLSFFLRGRIHSEHLNIFEFFSSMGGLTFDPWDVDLLLKGNLVRERDLPWEGEAFKETRIVEKTTNEQGVERTAEEVYRAIKTFYIAKLQFATPPKKSAKIQLDLLNAQGQLDKSRWLFYPRNVPVE